MSEKQFKFVFYNLILMLFFMGLLALPVGSVLFYKIVPRGDAVNVLSVTDSKNEEPGFVNGTSIQESTTSELMDYVYNYVNSNSQATSSENVIEPVVLDDSDD